MLSATAAKAPQSQGDELRVISGHRQPCLDPPEAQIEGPTGRRGADVAGEELRARLGARVATIATQRRAHVLARLRPATLAIRDAAAPFR